MRVTILTDSFSRLRASKLDVILSNTISSKLKAERDYVELKGRCAHSRMFYLWLASRCVREFPYPNVAES